MASQAAVRPGALSVIVLLAGMTGYFIGAAQTNHRTASSTVPSASSRPPQAIASSQGVAPAAGGSVDSLAAATSEQRWHRLGAEPSTPRRSQEMATLLTELARHDHDLAMQRALAEPNGKRRSQFRNAVLQGWAETAPQDAANFALTLREEDRTAAITAVFAGAVSQPDEAVKVAAGICDRDGTRAFEYAEALVAKLGERGDFDRAIRFLTDRPASPQRLEQMDNAFALWAENQPAAATAAMEKLGDSGLQEAAFRGAVVGWSHTDPAGLADYALHLPEGAPRSLALANAVPRWVELDPVAAATWLARCDPSPDFDLGVAAVANVPQIISNRPELAMSLAQGITDAPLRSNVLGSIAQRWATFDAAAATQYVNSIAGLSETDRTALLAAIRNPGG